MKKILAITQCFPCGSWLCIEKILEKLEGKDYKIHVLGYGKPSEKYKGVRYHLISYFAYARYGNITCINPAFGFLWYLPLYIAALFTSLVYNPKVVIYNGLTSSLVLSPLFKVLGKKNIIMYHTILGNDLSKTTKSILKHLFWPIDMVVVNSTGMRDDVSQVIDRKKVIVNEHFADDMFIKSTHKKIKPHSALRVLYAGRIDKDKRVFPLIDFAKKMKNNPDFEFTFVGSGADVNKVASLPKKYKHIKYGGYVDEKEKLAKLYHEADVVWGFGDTTYLCLPAVEALACDTPLVVPKYAAIANKDELINQSLVPSSIGWMVDPNDPKSIEKVMFKIQKDKKLLNKKCRQYACKYYSIDNLLNTVDTIIKEIES